MCANAIWRWNLDSVVDVHGNAITYRYKAEEGRYGQNLNKTIVSYTRGGYPDSIPVRTEHEVPVRAGHVAGHLHHRRAVLQWLYDGQPHLYHGAQYPDVPFDQRATATLGTVAVPATGAARP